jgi:hypothetical protein
VPTSPAIFKLKSANIETCFLLNALLWLLPNKTLNLTTIIFCVLSLPMTSGAHQKLYLQAELSILGMCIGRGMYEIMDPYWDTRCSCLQSRQGLDELYMDEKKRDILFNTMQEKGVQSFPGENSGFQ